MVSIKFISTDSLRVSSFKPNQLANTCGVNTFIINHEINKPKATVTHGAQLGVFLINKPKISGISSGTWIMVDNDIIKSNKLNSLSDLKNNATEITKIPQAKLTTRLTFNKCLSSITLFFFANNGW